MERGEYAEAARLLEAVQQLAAHFAAFGAVPKVTSCTYKFGMDGALPLCVLCSATFGRLAIQTPLVASTCRWLQKTAVWPTHVCQITAVKTSTEQVPCSGQPWMTWQVAELGGRVAALQTSLQLAAMREFELLGVGEDRANPLLLDRLRACCLVVDVLGAQVARPTLPTQDLRSRFLCAAPL